MLTKTFTADPAPEWPVGLRYIQNGDSLNTGNHETQAADVAQALSHLKGAVSGDAGIPVELADVTVTEPIKTSIGSIPRVVQAMPTTDNATAWEIDFAGKAEQAANALGYLRWELDIPHDAVLTSVSVYVKGAAGHSSLPTGTDRPLFTVAYVTNAGSNPALGDEYDASASVGTYEVTHAITVPIASHEVDRTANRYYAYLRTERGSNYVQGLQVYNVTCTFTPASYDPG